MLSFGLSAVLFLGLCISSAVGYGQKILVLGGDGMLGSETVARLKLRGNDITVLHRGTWYWDSSKRIKPWVNFIQCDRDYFNECSDKLEDVTREKGMWDAVFDFSGYKPKQIKVNSYLNKLYISSGKRCQPRKTREQESKQRCVTVHDIPQSRQRLPPYDAWEWASAEERVLRLYTSTS